MCFTWWVFQGAVSWHGSGLKVRPDVPLMCFRVLPRLLVCCQPTKAEHSGAGALWYSATETRTAWGMCSWCSWGCAFCSLERGAAIWFAPHWPGPSLAGSRWINHTLLSFPRSYSGPLAVGATTSLMVQPPGVPLS